MITETRGAIQQRDNLCGPFHGARLLLDAGITEWEGAAIDQDLVALHAGTSLPLQPRGPQCPDGAESLLDYRYELPRVDQEDAGTGPGGLAAALELLSGARLRAVPLRGRWRSETVVGLLDAAPALGIRLIANIRTGFLWHSRPPIELLLAELAGAPIEAAPAAEWDVGHFVELSALVRGAGGGLVVVRDSYPSIGCNGYHLQPARVIAAALNRDDGRDGGVLALVGVEQGEPVAALAERLALETQLWNN
jgi:hypothetical protein